MIPSTQEALERGYRDFRERMHAPGLVAGVVREGRLDALLLDGVVDAAGATPVAANTRFRIASMTKCMTALGVLALRDAGRLGLDQPVVEHVPELRGLAPVTRDSAAITVRDLVVHLSGWVNDDPWADRQLGMEPPALSALLRAGPLAARAPGLAHEYSNLGYAVLGRVIAAAAGTTYQRYVTELLIEPLGMPGTGFDWRAGPSEELAMGHRWTDGCGWSAEPPEPDGEFAAIGGLLTTASDYARFLAWILSAWPARDGPDLGPVRRSTVRELGIGHGPPRPVTDVGGTSIPSVYGHGMIVSDLPGSGLVLHHAGGLPGYGSHVVLLPNAGVAVFGMTNRTYAYPFAENLEVLRLLQEAGLTDVAAKPVSAALARAAAAVRGSYERGALEPLRQAASANLFLDVPEGARGAEIASLRARLGRCSAVRVEAMHALSGRLHMDCENGALRADVLLDPTPDAGIQRLSFDEA